MERTNSCPGELSEPGGEKERETNKINKTTRKLEKKNERTQKHSKTKQKDTNSFSVGVNKETVPHFLDVIQQEQRRRSQLHVG